MTIAYVQRIREGIRTPDLKRQYNKDLFTRVAREYDTATRVMSLGRDHSWKAALVDMLPPSATQFRCLDLACGTGDVTGMLARRYPTGVIMGVDLTTEMLDVARERFSKPNVRFVEGDMCHLDLPDGWADIVTGSYALRNAPVLNDMIAEVRRVLRPGGVAAFLDFRKSRNPRAASMQIGLLKYWCSFSSILVHGKPEHAYISESMRSFPDSDSLAARFVSNGFRVLRRRPMFFGVTEAMLVERL
jgi:ubiquinone/menaquinone biosynthesis methyltransferase